ncbi:MAG TPA: type II toxin-antitoxin system VapC family toxin [Vineibacter sp.]|nr:type II toxin-antitoxin system VapC family toxin [Vineibacter sp.]
MLLDTCAALWLMDRAHLAPAAIRAIRSAQASDAVHVSPISAWEIGMLTAKGRLRLDRDPQEWFDTLLSFHGVRLADLSPTILIASTRLPGQAPRDPADRIIAATARHHDWPVVTRDSELLPYARAGHLRAIRC